MSLAWYSVGISAAPEGLDPLLPHIAGVIENMEEATVVEIQNQIERDLNTGISTSDVVNAVENGVRLGLFKMEKEFKVCREFTSKGLDKITHLDFAGVLPRHKGVMQCGKQKQSLMDYVKSQREIRRRKMLKGRRIKRSMLGSSGGYWDNGKRYAQLCDRCKSSIERKLVERNRRRVSVNKHRERKSAERSRSSDSECSEDNSEHDRRAPVKSKLLIERNSMETVQPYCDIFT